MKGKYPKATSPPPAPPMTRRHVKVDYATEIYRWYKVFMHQREKLGVRKNVLQEGKA